MERITLVITLLIFALNTFGADNTITIKVKKAIVYGEAVNGEFEGRLKDFTESKYFEPEYSEGELSFTLSADKSYFSSARTIARYAWKHLTGGVTVERPYPCGLYYNGNINESHDRDENDVYTYYGIDGMGDGSFDSCTGQGGPGWWSYKVSVKFNPIDMTGTITYGLEEE